jgi:hypothetical protein
MAAMKVQGYIEFTVTEEEFECLAFKVGCFARALIKTAQYGGVVGWE